jgi:ribosome-associated protein
MVPSSSFIQRVVMEIELKVSSRVSIPMREIQLQAIRSQGAGGQNVNKVATAVHLFFDIRASSLPEVYKQRLLERKDRRISPAGTVIIKSQESRTQEANREKALGRLKELIKEAMQVRKARRATRPTRASKERRLQAKETRSKTKKFRQRPGLEG